MLRCVVDVIFSPGSTSLIWASREGHLSVVKHLVEHKANIEAKNNNGMFLKSTVVILSYLYVHGGRAVVEADVYRGCDILSRLDSIDLCFE